MITEVEEFIKGVRAYREQEERDAVYKISIYLVSQLFTENKDEEIEGRRKIEWIADAVGTLLLVWNNAFYRYGPLDFHRLQEAIEQHYDRLLCFRNRSIESFQENENDEQEVREIFSSFEEATVRRNKDGNEMRTPVGTVKALHILAPNFFPLWDQKIARAYGYTSLNADNYISFMKEVKDLLTEVRRWELPPDIQPTLKSIDEFNFAKYTKNWI